MAAIKDPLDAPNLQVWISSDTYRNVANGTALASSAIQASAATYLPPQADTDAMYIFNDRNSNDHTTGLMTCWCWWTMECVTNTDLWDGIAQWAAAEYGLTLS